MEKLTRNLKKLAIRDSHPELPLDPDAARPGKYRSPHLTPSLQTIVLLGGSFGAFARYSMASVFPSPADGWPVATFAVNLVGALILGFLLEALARRGADRGARRVLRLLIGTGFIGVFTTYSTLAVETDLLLKNAHLGLAIAYAGLSVVGGLVCSAIGIQLAAAQHKHLARINLQPGKLATVRASEERR